jgi:hypothetical protein
VWIFDFMGNQTYIFLAKIWPILIGIVSHQWESCNWNPKLVIPSAHLLSSL